MPLSSISPMNVELIITPGFGFFCLIVRGCYFSFVRVSELLLFEDKMHNSLRKNMVSISIHPLGVSNAKVTSKSIVQAC